jgi:hypothetical protein
VAALVAGRTIGIRFELDAVFALDMHSHSSKTGSRLRMGFPVSSDSFHPALQGFLRAPKRHHHNHHRDIAIYLRGCVGSWMCMTDVIVRTMPNDSPFLRGIMIDIHSPPRAASLEHPSVPAQRAIEKDDDEPHRTTAIQLSSIVQVYARRGWGGNPSRKARKGATCVSHCLENVCWLAGLLFLFAFLGKAAVCLT